MARCLARFYHDSRRSQPCQPDRFRAALEVVVIVAFPLAVPHAAVLLRQRIPGLQGCAGVGCPQPRTAAAQEVTGAAHPYGRLLRAVLCIGLQ